MMRFPLTRPTARWSALLLHLILHLQREGYEWFLLGMAPLSGSVRRARPRRSGTASAGFAFEHGERFYNFSGLRAFKAKFLLEWQPHLAVRWHQP